MDWMDNFKSRIENQIVVGTRHHHEDIHRAFNEYRDLLQLNLTEPDDNDLEWWKTRAILLANDLDIRKPATMWQRRN